MAAEIRVPSLRFLTASTVSSSHEDSGLLHPDTGPGVRRVSVARVVAIRRWRGHGLLSLRRVDPSKVFSSSVAVPDRSGLLPSHQCPETASLRSGPEPVSTTRSPGSCRGPPAHHQYVCPGISSRSATTAPLRLAGICEPTHAVRRAQVAWTLSAGAGLPLADDLPYLMTDASTAETVDRFARPPRTELGRGGTSSRR